jgi:hypothetical protein
MANSVGDNFLLILGFRYGEAELPAKGAHYVRIYGYIKLSRD